MRTILAPGSTDRIGLLVGSCSREQSRGARVLFARIQPAPAEGAYTEGKVDGDGFPLHLRYSFAAEDVVPRRDYPGVAEQESTRDVAVQLGAGTHYLNYQGEVELAGGDGLWLVDIQMVQVPERHLHWHWLMRSVAQGSKYRLPHAHTVIGTYNPDAVLSLWDGEQGLRLRTGQVTAPTHGEIEVTSTGSTDPNLWIFTGWYG